MHQRFIAQARAVFEDQRSSCPACIQQRVNQHGGCLRMGCQLRRHMRQRRGAGVADHAHGHVFVAGNLFAGMLRAGGEQVCQCNQHGGAIRQRALPHTPLAHIIGKAIDFGQHLGRRLKTPHETLPHSFPGKRIQISCEALTHH